TLVVYTADQGWMGGANGLWGMGDHTRPLGAFDGMMRVPLIVRHPGRIAPGSKYNELVANYDIMPSLLNYLGFGAEVKRLTPASPGRDFSPVLRGESMEWENVVFYEMQHTRAIRTDRWKYVHRPLGPLELYDLEQDPGEKFNLFGQPGYVEIVAELRKRLDTFFKRNADPKYDLYRGGESKASLIADGTHVIRAGQQAAGTRLAE
ncbi:MAG: sulfatase, partial [Planctomycetota bacterium]